MSKKKEYASVKLNLQFSQVLYAKDEIYNIYNNITLLDGKVSDGTVCELKLNLLTILINMIVWRWSY